MKMCFGLSIYVSLLIRKVVLKINVTYIIFLKKLVTITLAEKKYIIKSHLPLGEERVGK